MTVLGDVLEIGCIYVYVTEEDKPRMIYTLILENISFFARNL